MFLEQEVIREQEALTAEFKRFESEQTDRSASFLNAEAIADSNALTPPSKAKPAAGKLSEGETIELNGAGIAVIKRLPGVGDKYAQRIADYHNRLGGFVSLEQLTEVEGITPNRLKKLAPYIRLQRKPKQLKINSLSAQQLAKHPYIDEKQAQSIVEARKLNRLRTPDDLRQLEYFTPRDIDRLSGYISFD